MRDPSGSTRGGGEDGVAVARPDGPAMSDEVTTWQAPGPLLAPSQAAMPAEHPRLGEDPAELVARVSAAKRDVLLRVHRHRLGFEDLEDCYSQATLELVTRARARGRAFLSAEHIANALEQRFLSRITDRQRAVSGRSPIAAATESALRHSDDQKDGPDSSGVAVVADPSADVAGRLASQEDVRRLREVADELTADQRLVLACQVALDMDCQESARASGGQPRSSARWRSALAHACAF